MRTLFVENLPGPGAEIVPERREAEHLFRVLRAVPGEEFRLLDGRGGRAVARVCPGRVLAVESRETLPEPERKYHLFFALPRRNRLDALLPACSELGVWELHPCVCARSVAEGVNAERWRLQLIEGCKQSGNPFLPRVEEPEPLLPCVRRAAEGGMTLFYGSVARTGEPPASAGRDVGWIVGPEGGFTPEEERGLREAGGRPLNLGEWVLRLETAALCGLAVLRKLASVAPVLFLALWLCGCSGRDVSRHPLVRKGDRCREVGDCRTAAFFYRRALEKYPESPTLCLKLATLYDESLDEPLAAAWYYSEFLRVAPDSRERAAVEKCRDMAVRRLERPPENVAALRAELERQRQYSRFLEREKRRLEEEIRDLRGGAPREKASPAVPPAREKESSHQPSDKK